LANAAFTTIRRLSPPGMGLPPHLCLRLAKSLLEPILLYGIALWVPPAAIMDPMRVFWHRVCRWITNCFSSTPLPCLHREACLPPLSTLVILRRRQAGLRVLCSPPEINPATSFLPPAVPTFSSHRTTRPPQPKIGIKPYLFFHLAWDAPTDKVRNPRYRHTVLTALAHTVLPLLHGSHSLPPINLHLTDYLPPSPSGGPTFKTLKDRARHLLYEDWANDPPSSTIGTLLPHVPTRLWD
jgi:hypothetical protein